MSRPPVAFAGAAALIAAAGLVAMPSGAASADVPALQITIADRVGRSDGSMLTDDFIDIMSQRFDYSQFSHYTCAIDFGDGSAPGGYFASSFGSPSPCLDAHRYAAAGTYTVTMTVTDTDDGDSETATGSVTVSQRQVRTVTGATEGAVVGLAAPDGAGQVHWTAPVTDACYLTNTDAAATRLGCADEGTYVVLFDGDTAAASGEYDVSFVNGPPRPTVEPVRYRRGGEVVSPRVGTGDSLGIAVDARDPSWRLYSRDPHRPANPIGDALTCRFDFGDGTTDTDHETLQDTCGVPHVYTSAGAYTVTVTVTDDSGATATRSTSVQVMRRDVRVGTRGADEEGLRGHGFATLDPTGIDGEFDFRLPSGRRVLVPHIDQLSVDAASVSAGGPATVNGRSGFSLYATFFRSGKRAISLSLVRGVGGAYVEEADGARSEFTDEYDAPPIR